VIVALLLSTRLLNDPPIGAGIYALGLASGAAIALQSVGIVLVYRSNRIINFAQVNLGLLGGALFVQLVQRRLFLTGLQAVCPPCVPRPQTIGDLARVPGEGAQALLSQPGFDAAKDIPLSSINGFEDALPSGVDLDDLGVFGAPGWMVSVNFWLSMVVALAAVLLLSWLTYTLIVRRFRNAPRLIVTVMTIGLSQVLLVATSQVVSLLAQDGLEGDGLQFFPTEAKFPFTISWRLRPIVVTTTDVMLILVTVAIVAGLVLFFRRSAMGVVLRGASENADRAQTLGINVDSVTSVVWMMAGGLSGVASIIAATGVGSGGGQSIVRYLTAAVFGGFVSLPITVLAAFTVGIVDQSLQFSGPPGAIDGVLLAAIVIVLLVQRSRSTRSDTETDGGWKAAREMRPIPRDLRSLDVVRRWVRSLRAFGAVALLGLPWVLSPSQTNLLTVTLVYAMIGLSLLVLTGWAGQISLGQFGFAAVGAWATAVSGLPMPLSLVVGGIAGAVVAVVIGIPALRLGGLHLAITTIAFAVAATSLLVNPRYLGRYLPENLRRPTLLGLNLDDQRTFFYVVLVFLGLTVAAVVGMRRSRTARALIACRDNDVAAQAFGINLLRARLSAFAASGFLAAVAGGIFAYSQYGVNATNFDYTQSINMFLMVVIGGLGSVAGPLLGATYLGLAGILGEELPIVGLAATGIGTVAVLLALPGGLGELAYGIRDAVLRRIADRYRIDVPTLTADRADHATRAPLPGTLPGRGVAFVPKRYRLEEQWSVERRHEEITHV